MTNFRYTLVSTRWLFAAVTLVFGMMVFATPAHAIVVASIDITDVDVDNGPSTVVEPSDSVEVDVTVTTVGTGEGNDWESTSYEILIDGQPGMQCVNTTDHLFAGVYTETFNITAPADPGTYDLQIKIYRDSDNCTGFNDTQTFADVIVVAEPTPILGCMDDAATNYNPDATVNDESCVYPKATIVATKLVCTDETDLPNWGAAGGPNITSTTASDWLVEHESCSLQSGWNFQWVLDSVKTDPGDTMTGEAGDPWVTFGPTNGSGVASAELFAADLGEESKIWLREVLQSGYIPFTHDQNSDTNVDNVSAEFYCHTDVINYDNYDWISGIELENTYYCVAWNVAEDVPTYPVSGYKWGDTDGDGIWDEGEFGLEGWTIYATEDADVSEPEVRQTTTATDGSYSFDLPAGNWIISEEDREGWTQTAPVDPNTCGFTLGSTDKVYRTLVLLDDSNTCTFGNHQTASVCRVGNNLLSNGSFEDPAVDGSWDIFSSVSNWVVSLSDGLELWRNFMGGPSDGEQNTELDGNASTQVTQTVATIPGATYELRFDFSPRPGTGLGDNSVDALIDGSTIMNASGDGSNLTATSWTTHSQTFVASGVTTDVALKDVGTSNSTGSLADNAVLCLVSEPEPEQDALACTFTSDDYTVNKGGDFILTWTTDNASSVTITNLDGEIALDGTRTTSINSDTTYLLTASRYVGDEETPETITCEVTIDVGSSGGSSSSGSRRHNNNNNDEGGEVLGESTTRVPEVLGEAIAPAGAPNAGAGGAAAGTFGSIFALLGMAVSFGMMRGARETK